MLPAELLEQDGIIGRARGVLLLEQASVAQLVADSFARRLEWGTGVHSAPLQPIPLAGLTYVIRITYESIHIHRCFHGQAQPEGRYSGSGAVSNLEAHRQQYCSHAGRGPEVNLITV